jgi:CRISPR-associated protein Cas5/CasD subtype I-E
MLLIGRLQGWIQSWSLNPLGLTQPHATKSGVFGMIMNCFGYDRQEANRRVAELNKLKFHVRVDSGGVIFTDYQTVRGPLLTAEKEVKFTVGTKMIETYVRDKMQYLCDARFTFFLEGESGLLEDVASALQYPASVPYLGRSCCLPTYKLFESLSEGTLEDVAATVPARLPPGVELPEDVSMILFKEQAGGTPVKDVLLSSIPHVLGFRTVKPYCVQPPVVFDKLMAGKLPRTRRRRKPPDWVRHRRFVHDGNRCVYCGVSSTLINPLEFHHVNYDNAGNERLEDGISLCKKVCHAAVTSMHYADPSLGYFDPRKLTGATRELFEIVRRSRLEYDAVNARILPY